MALRTELFLAWKYFKPKRSAVSVITLISVIGVGLGVAVLMVVLAVMTGFTDMMKAKLLATGAHAQIQKAMVFSDSDGRGHAGVFASDEAANVVRLAEMNGADAMPVLVAPVLLQVEDSFAPKVLAAFENGADKHNRFELASAVRSGKKFPGRGEILISEVIARDYMLPIGSKVLLHAPSNLARLIEKDPQTGRYRASANAEYYLPSEYTVAGTFSFGKYDFDKDMMFMALDDADELFNVEWGAATHVYLWIDDPFDVESFIAKFAPELKKISPASRVASWQKIHSQILNVLAVEKDMMFFLLVFIVLVAAFSITSTLITTVFQKTREIGLLKALGASSPSVMRIFVLQGFFVGLIGSLAGTVVGWLVVTFRMDILEVMRKVSGQNIFPREVYLFNELPAHIIWSDTVLICAISIALCTLGALIPSLRAARLDPAKALRYE